MIRADVELLRLVAAFGIVWFHSGYPMARDIAYSGLIVFLILSAFFAINADSKPSVAERATRLLLPCLFWSTLYGALLIISGKVLFSQNTSWISALLTTPSIHLWYLPFAFLFLVSVDLFRKHMRPSHLAILSVITAITMLATASAWRQWTYEPPFGQYMHALAAVCIGVYFALLPKLKPWLRHLSLTALCLVMAFVLLMGMPGLSQTYFAGFASTLILLRSRSTLPASRALLALSRTTFGVYLIHPLILFLSKSIGFTGMSLPVISFLISIFCVYLALKVMPQRVIKIVF